MDKNVKNKTVCETGFASRKRFAVELLMLILLLSKQKKMPS